jgi:cation transport ATPase
VYTYGCRRALFRFWTFLESDRTAAAMSLSSAAVIGNALRLRGTKIEP